jgi:hypothetical protein
MLHRPYIRSEVRAEVEARAEKNEQGQFLDANTGKPIEGQYDLGHKAGHEFRTEQALAEQEGLTQAEFNDKMNNPDLYQIEDSSSNRSHQFEATENSKEETTEEEITANGNTLSEVEDETESSDSNESDDSEDGGENDGDDADGDSL